MAIKFRNATSPTSSAQETEVSLGNPLPINDLIANSLVPSQYDYISLGYTGTDLTSVIYKTGGASGATISTLTLAYSGGNLVSITKS